MWLFVVINCEEGKVEEVLVKGVGLKVVLPRPRHPFETIRVPGGAMNP